MIDWQDLTENDAVKAAGVVFLDDGEPVDGGPGVKARQVSQGKPKWSMAKIRAAADLAKEKGATVRLDPDGAVTISPIEQAKTVDPEPL